MDFKNTYLITTEYDTDECTTRTSIDFLTKELLTQIDLTIEEYIEETTSTMKTNKIINTRVLKNIKQKELIQEYLNNGYQIEYKEELKKEIIFLETKQTIKNF